MTLDDGDEYISSEDERIASQLTDKDVLATCAILAGCGVTLIGAAAALIAFLLSR